MPRRSVPILFMVSIKQHDDGRAGAREHQIVRCLTFSLLQLLGEAEEVRAEIRCERAQTTGMLHKMAGVVAGAVEIAVKSAACFLLKNMNQNLHSDYSPKVVGRLAAS